MATSAIFSAIDEAPLHAVEKLKAISSHAHGRYKPEHSVAETNAVQDVFFARNVSEQRGEKIAQCRKNTYYKAEHDVWSLNKPEKNKPNQATACSVDPVSASRQSDSSSISFRADVPKNEYITGTRIKTISVVAANPKTSDVAIGTKN